MVVLPTILLSTTAASADAAEKLKTEMVSSKESADESSRSLVAFAK